MRTNLSMLLTGAVLAAAASAQGTVVVNSDISTSTTWTANNTYDLARQIYVLPGATLTIEAGTRIASTASANGSGSLAVAKGAQILAKGTVDAPIVFTSSNDNGSWREAANEWGNVTIMGDGYVSENATPGNVASCNASNVAQMEGLTPSGPNDTRVLYGGGNDDDDSGCLEYVSIRFGGRVVGLNNELNGLSLGGIGRETDIHHVEIMNNVDDGIEIWGGTVNLKYFAIWNIGDDSLDFDQGWRGKGQFGLIVQGYSLDASQGSGVGDNCIEHDGAEDSDWCPRSQVALYNMTVIGQFLDGDHATAWRDNARVQHSNSIFIDIGDDLVRFDNVDGDGANGYGHNGTLSWPQHWTTDWNMGDNVNGARLPAASIGQASGKLCSMTNTIAYNIADVTEANARGVFAAGNNNSLLTASAALPIRALNRAMPVIKGGKLMEQVIGLDPRPAGLAATKCTRRDTNGARFAPKDGFFNSAAFCGAFRPGGAAWDAQWTAAYEFGFRSGFSSDDHVDLGDCGEFFAMQPARDGGGEVNLGFEGATTSGGTVQFNVTNAPPSTVGAWQISFAVAPTTVPGPSAGQAFTLCPSIALGFNVGIATNANGEFSFSFPWPNVPSGTGLYSQVFLADPTPGGFVIGSNTVQSIAR